MVGPQKYKYDKLNRSVEITDAEGGKTTYTYDGVGNLKSVNDPNSNNGGNSNNNGHTVTYVYDGLDRLIKKLMR